MLNLTATNLRRTFQDNVAVKDVSLELREGESVGLVGPNGAGKSTTIAMLSTLLKPTAGDVTLNGDSVISRPEPLRKILGVVPQEIALYPELTAEENLRFFGSLYGLKGQELNTAVDEALELVQLSDRRKESIKKYSGGMKRRINIAAALLHGPRIVIMDEPTVGVDPQSRNHILESVRTLNRDHGLTVLYTSHYMEEVEQLCDRIYIMDHGEIIAEGTKDAIKDQLATLVIHSTMCKAAGEAAMANFDVVVVIPRLALAVPDLHVADPPLQQTAGGEAVPTLGGINAVPQGGLKII